MLNDVTHIQCRRLLLTQQLPVPEYETGSRKGFPHGIRSLELPIKLKNGPQTVVVLRANVTSPEVELSHEELDFDSVLVGQSKTMYIQV